MNWTSTEMVVVVPMLTATEESGEEQKSEVGIVQKELGHHDHVGYGEIGLAAIALFTLIAAFINEYRR